MPLNTREIEKSILGAVHEKNIDKINEVLDQITPAELNKIRPLYLGFILQSSYDEYTQRDSKKEILTKLIAFGIDPNIHGYDDPTLLNQAVRKGNIECIKLLVSSPLIDLEIKNQDGLTPLSYAARIGNREIMDLLVSKGAKHDGPLPNKIPQKDLQELIDNIDTKELKLGALLEEKFYDKDLSHYRIKIMPGKFDSIDFSDISLEKSSLSLEDISSSAETRKSAALPYINFRNCNLKNANLGYCGFLTEKSSLNVANNIEGVFAITDRKFLSNFSAEQINASNIMLIEDGRQFKQGNLISANPELNMEGVCNGLCIEYARYHTKERSPSEKLSHDNIINKLSKEMQTENFLGRVEFAQQHLQYKYLPESYQVGKTIAHPEDYASYDIEEMLRDQFKTSNVIGINFARHAMAIRVIKDDKGDIMGYRYFDPNHGESPILNSLELKKQIQQVWSNLIKSLNLGEPRTIRFRDLEEQVKRLNVLSSEGKNMHLLNNAMKENNLEDVKKYAKTTTIIDDIYGGSMLGSAVEIGTKEAIQVLLENTKSIDYQKSGDLVLMSLICHKKLTEPIVDILVQNNVNLDKGLTEAARRDLVAVKLLVAHGANLHEETNQFHKPTDKIKKFIQNAIRERDTAKAAAAIVAPKLTKDIVASQHNPPEPRKNWVEAVENPGASSDLSTSLTRGDAGQRRI